MKISFGMIVFNGNYVLKECIESIYPFAYQILIAEGPVKYWQSMGYMTSVDGTNEILHSIPDPENKIKIVHGQFEEKTDQCNAYMKYLKSDSDYIWNLDCDEIFKPEDVDKLLSVIEKEKYTTVAFKSCSFFGGFTHKLTGFEENAQFIRIRKVYPGSYWKTHRPPTISYPVPENKMPEKQLGHRELFSKYGIRMYHYSYVFPRQVYEKVNYYKSAVSRSMCLDNYYHNVYLKWVLGDSNQKNCVENEYSGVHEWKPEHRGPCRTEIFKGDHPKIILKNMDKLKSKFCRQLEIYNRENTDKYFDSCWYKNNGHKSMVDVVVNKKWPALESSVHFPALKELINESKTKGKLLDIGCGSAELQNTSVVKNFYYYGLDIPDVIDNVAIQLNKKGKYIKKDLLKDFDIGILGTFDLIVMNAFLDIMPNPLEILDRVLYFSRCSVIVHRQKTGNNKTSISKEPAYNDNTFSSYINIEDFDECIKRNNYVIKKEISSNLIEYKSYLLERMVK